MVDMLKQIVCWFKGHDWLYVEVDNIGWWDKCQRCGLLALPDDEEGFA